MTLTPFDLSKINVASNSIYRKMKEIIDYFYIQKGVAYISCEMNYLGGADIGRYLTYDGRRAILIANSYAGFSASEQLDTIVHESIHCAGEEWILGRTETSPIDMRYTSYWLEEYITLRATSIVCKQIGIYNLNPRPIIGDALTKKAHNELINRIRPEGISELEPFIDAASKHILTRNVKKLGLTSDVMKKYIIKAII